jgi:ABC-2 type transport system permease protein
MSIWMFSLFFLQLIIARPIAELFVPDVTTAGEALKQMKIEQWLSRLSPDVLFNEASNTLLNPTVRTLGPSPEELDLPLPTPISATQSLRLVWPHIIAMVSGVVGLVVVSYAKFMREEIRS